jgi:hypothetical protein
MVLRIARPSASETVLGPSRKPNAPKKFRVPRKAEDLRIYYLGPTRECDIHGLHTRKAGWKSEALGGAHMTSNIPPVCARNAC